MLLPCKWTSFLGFGDWYSSSVSSPSDSSSLMIACFASLMVELEKCASSLADLHNARGFESKYLSLHFDPWHGKHSVSHVPSCSFSGENYLFLSHSFQFYYFHFVSLLLLFDFYYFGFSVKVPGRFRVVPAGSCRFQVGSASYIHPSETLTTRCELSEELSVINSHQSSPVLSLSQEEVKKQPEIRLCSQARDYEEFQFL